MEIIKQSTPKGRIKKKKKKRNFSLSSGTEKIKKIKNDLHAMKRILYDTGNLRGVRWLLQRGLKFQSPI